MTVKKKIIIMMLLIKKNDEIIYVELVQLKIDSIESTKISSINDLYNINKIYNELTYPKIN